MNLVITIRKTIKEDARILIKIQKEAFKPIYERYHDEGNPFLREENDILDRLMRPDSEYYTIFDDEHIVGGILYKHSCSTPFCENLGSGEYYLCRVYIKPSAQGKKIARTAIKLCEEKFDNAVRYYVDFPEELEKNRRCYESAGYSDTGERLQITEQLTLAYFTKTAIKKNVAANATTI